jgi:hypothetical protein
MLLPKKEISFRGRAIPVVRCEETGWENGDGLQVDTALYQDREKNFYVAFLVQKSIDECAKMLGRTDITFPEDNELVEPLREAKLTIRRASERAAVAWYLEQFLSDGPVKSLLSEAAAKLQRAKKGNSA